MAILRKRRERTEGEPPAGGPRRRLKHRLPVRLRHYWRIPVAVIAGLAALVLVFGDARVRPYFGAEPVAEDTVTDSIEGQGDLFGDGEHTIEVTYNESEYADMMRTFREEGEKEFIRADITIDGTVVNDVGLRLKGNSTLASLGGSGGMPGGGEGGPPAAGAEGQGQPEGAPQEGGEAGEGGEAQDEEPAGGGEAQGPGGEGGDGPAAIELSEDEPETIPWLISFEEFSEGRAYQGHTEITLRPGIGDSATALNEALALELTAADGQTTQDSAFTGFSVNGGDAVPRLVLDSPDAAWAEERGDGVLYKARAGGSFEYLGDDPTDYEEAFNQINGEGVQDLQPVMDLLHFVDEADDEEFARDLGEHLDTESFARYLALQNLMSNGDAMDGPGNNYYLWYDTENERFTVLSWDLNLSFGVMEDMMPSGGTGGGGDGGGQPELPDGEVPEGFPGGEGAEGGPGGGPGSGGAMGSGALKERFLDNAEFTELYEEAYADLYSSLVASGTAADLLEQAAGRAEAAGDSGADSTAEKLAEHLGSISKEPQEDVGLPGPGNAGEGDEAGTEE